MSKYVIGIDEVGRGALAGPVVVAAALVKKGKRISAPKSLGKLKDSKRLTAKQRESWSAYFKDHPHIKFAIARVYPRQIERRNISSAANLAAERATGRLLVRSKLKVEHCSIYLDGGLFLGNTKSNPSTRSVRSGRITVKTVIRGDEKITIIKIASIMAKVSRDAFMRRLAKKYPDYGFDVHKGYGTKVHMAALKNHGSSDVHRLTFIRRYANM